MKLQNQVLPIPFEPIKKEVESELGNPINEVFLEFNEEPLACASIAQVHKPNYMMELLLQLKYKNPIL